MMEATKYNKSDVNRWLILSYCTNADGRAAALHVDNRLPYLKSLGITPVMLSGPNFPRHAEISHARVPSISPAGIWFEFRTFLNLAITSKSLRNTLKAVCMLPLMPFYFIEKAFIDIESQWAWFLPAAVKGQQLIRRHRPSLIYSTGGSISAHLAARLLARWNGLPWIAELQDPLVHGDWLRSRRALKIYSKVERLICAHAKHVVFLTDKARERAAGRTLLGEKGRVIYPGARPAAFSATYVRGEHCRFTHLGSLGGTRNLKVFLEALALYLAENPAMAPILRLELYGRCDRLSLELIESFPYPEVIKNHGRVPHQESLAVMHRSDVLLLIQDREEFSSETIPSKSYEYLLAGRPILGLVYGNQELREMLVDLGHQAADAADVQDVKNGIALMVEQWRSGSFNPRPSPYTVEAAAGRLKELAEIAVCAAKGKGAGSGV